MLLESKGHATGTVNKHDIDHVVSNLSYSDWLILYYLEQSMNKKNFGELLQKMSTEEYGSSRRTSDGGLDSSVDSVDGAATLKSPARFKNMFSSKNKK